MGAVRRALPLGLRTSIEKKLVRLLTKVAAHAPWLWRWRAIGWFVRGTFDPMARHWESNIARHGDWSAPLAAGLEQLPHAPRRALDLGTGTGLGASLIARRFPGCEVTGADISPRMVAEARRLHSGLPNVRFVEADSYSLPFNDSGFDLVTLLNVPPFFGEIRRVTAAGGAVLICFSLAERTPIYLPTPEVERKLLRHGFTAVRSGRAGKGVWTLGVKLVS